MAVFGDGWGGGGRKYRQIDVQREKRLSRD